MPRTYILTGAGSGIGLATATLVRERGDVAIGVDLKGAEVTADLSTPEGRRDGAMHALELAAGNVDAVIACAGIAAPIAKTVQVNYFGTVEFLEAVRPALARSASPRAAVVSSMASLQPNFPALVDALLARDEERAVQIGTELAEQGPQVGYLNYSSSKRALSRWVRHAAISDEWAGAHIPLNAVAPGTVTTPMTADMLQTGEGRKTVDDSVPMPLNYHQGPEVIARLLLWLTSEENTHCAGQTIYCDGGADATLRGDDVWSWNDPPPR